MNIEVKMSQRLIAIAEMLKGDYQVDTVADVGCDHGYVSIYMIQKGIAQKAIAMDVRKGPLSMAEDNIRQMGLGGRIEVRLSDGLAGLKKGEADSLVIAGMGGRLVMSILEQSDPSLLGIKLAVLQPQSELEQFRQYLGDKGYRVIDERIILDDGKYYFPMLVSFEKADMENTGADHNKAFVKGMSGVYNDISYHEDCIESVKKLILGKVPDEELDKTVRRLVNRYGAINIIRRDPLLKPFLEHGREVALSVISGLDEAVHSQRIRELRQEISDIELL